ncbi:MAG: F0F1 ATP synthase subunit epsilon [Chloroflexota bacterium]|nr:MAG: F0F1 ATP synthase subunit epsilon [Chloroflexota bacterium]
MSIHLDIVTIERVVVSEEVDYVSAPGIDGVLGILPKHEPLLTALSIGELHYRKGGQETSFAIGGGFMEVRPDKVTVLADVAESADEIDEQRAEAARKRAQELMSQKVETGSEAVQAVLLEQTMRRAELRLKVARRRRSGTQE